MAESLEFVSKSNPSKKKRKIVLGIDPFKAPGVFRVRTQIFFLYKMKYFVKSEISENPTTKSRFLVI